MGLLRTVRRWRDRRTIKRAVKLMRRQRGYDGAGTQRWLWGDMLGSDMSANGELLHALPLLRCRCRELYRNNATARAAVESVVSHTIGTGIDVEPDLGMGEDVDKCISDAWHEWCEVAGANGMSLWELQTQAERTCELAGSAFWHFVELADMSRPIPLAIHSYEPDQLADAPVDTMAPGARFCMGIEYDNYSRPIAYHFVAGDDDYITGGGFIGTLVPGSKLTSGEFGGGMAVGGRHGVRIPACDIVHLYDALRPGQLFGEPGLAPVMGRIHQEGELIDYELTAARVGAQPAIAITTEGGGELTGLAGGSADSDGEDDGDGTAGNGNDIMTLEPGLIAKLLRGEDIKTIENKRPSQHVAPFSQFIRGGIAAAMGLRPIDLDRDYSAANYSSLRAAQIDLQRRFAPRQFAHGRQLAGRVYLRALPQLAFNESVRLGIPGTVSYRRCCRHTLQPQGWAYVDPQKDVAGALAAISAGLSTWRDELQSRGKNPRDIREQLAKEIANNPLLAQIFAAALKMDPETAKLLEQSADETAPVFTPKPLAEPMEVRP